MCLSKPIPRENFEKIAQGTDLAQTWNKPEFIQTFFSDWWCSAYITTLNHIEVFFPFFCLSESGTVIRSRRLQAFNGQVDYAWMEKVAVDASSRRDQG